MTETRKKPPKAVKAVGSVLAVLLIIAAGFTVVSHAVYHRSDMATLVEIYFRILGTKKKFADVEECAEYIEQRRNAGEYALTAKLKSDVSEQMVNGNRVYVLSGSDEPDYLVLYLHGGAYINDASAAHWSFCDKLVQKANAEVVFPIYPLTPNHTWGETFELITTVYQEILEAATVRTFKMCFSLWHWSNRPYACACRALAACPQCAAPYPALWFCLCPADCCFLDHFLAHGRASAFRKERSEA